MQRKDYTNHCRRDSGNFHIFKESDKKHPTMGKYRESGEEVSVNTDRCPEKLGPNTYRRP